MDYAEIGYESSDHDSTFAKKYVSASSVCSIDDIFPKYNNDLRGYLFKGLTLSRALFKAKKSEFLSILLESALHKIFTRVVDGDTFVGPTGDKIYVGPIPDHIVKQLRQDGHFDDINIIKTNFQLPEVVYEFSSATKKRKTKKISLPAALRVRMYRNLESGKLKLTKKVYEKY